MESLFEGIQKDKLDKWKFEASLHGVDLGTESSDTSSPAVQSDPSVPLFGDPEQYQSLSNEEREVATKKMLHKHRVWAGESFKKG